MVDPSEAYAIRAFVRQALALPLADGTLRAVTVPSPLRAIEALFAYSCDERAFLWAPPLGPAVVGLGCARVISASGDQRCAQLVSAAQAERLERRAFPGALELPTLWFGGLAFSSGDARATTDDAWSPFPDSLFILPRWRYIQLDNKAALTITLSRRDLEQPERIEAELQALTAPAAANLPASAMDVGHPVQIRHLPMADWRSLVESHLRVLRRGEATKVVAARRSIALFERALDARDLAGVLWHLHGTQSDCTRFALRVGGATFLGATPERLLRKEGRAVATEALAGSRPAPTAADEEMVVAAKHELLESRKDRMEHALVVDEITARLTPVCESVSADSIPAVRRLRHVLHLCTPIAGVLRADAHILNLVDLLHPTPAVAGLPTEVAMARIVAQEPAPRGYYAGPIGWFDQDGDGDFSVALRSAVLRGRHAFIYAGAGLVDGSEAESEYAETAVKQRAVLDALGGAS